MQNKTHIVLTHLRPTFNFFDQSTWEHLGKHLGTPTNQEVILPSLTPFATERFLLLRQIVVNCFNLKEINSVHLTLSAVVYKRNCWRLIFFDRETDYGEASTREIDGSR